MYRIGICSNYEDTYYECKKVIEFHDLDASLNWLVEFLKHDKEIYANYCFEIDEEKAFWFRGLTEEDFEDFYLTITLADDNGSIAGYMSSDGIVYGSLSYAENNLGELNFYEKFWLISINSDIDTRLQDQVIRIFQKNNIDFEIN